MTSTSDTPRFYTVDEVASMLRIGRTTAYRLTHSGELPSVRIGNQFRIPAKALVDRLSRSQVR